MEDSKKGVMAERGDGECVNTRPLSDSGKLGHQSPVHLKVIKIMPKKGKKLNCEQTHKVFGLQIAMTI